MKSFGRCIIYITTLLLFQVHADLMGEKYCLNKDVLLGSKQASYKVIEVQLFSKLELKCHYCEDPESLEASLWYKRPRGIMKDLEEVSLDMNINMLENHIYTTANHNLIFNNFTLIDSGLYECNGPNGGRYSYVLEERRKPHKGTLEGWKDYEAKYLLPLSNNFRTSNTTYYGSLRFDYSFIFQVFTTWGDWGTCVAYGKNIGKGEKLRRGHCRILAEPYTEKGFLGFNDSAHNEIRNYFLVDNFQVPCRSMKLFIYLFNIGNILKFIPDYLQTENCYVKYSPASNQSEFKYSLKYNVPEHSHLKLVCPEATVDSEVVWKKNQKTLDDKYRNNMAENEEEPHITIDTSSTLFIMHASKDEAGLYSCLVDGVKMESIAITVSSRTAILTEEFLRHAIYLSFVLLLSLSCYCIGLCIACQWRHLIILSANNEIKADIEECEELMN